MTATTDVTTDGARDEEAPAQPEASYDYGPPAQPASGRAVIATRLLTAHPGNVRRDIHLDQEFLDSIAELGILTPLRITPDGGGGYRVIEGHRRLAAAEKLGHAEVPCDLAAEREGDEAGQFLDMYAANHHRKSLSTLEEADALFGASANGASKRRIRKATGLSPDEVASALKAAGMSGLARETAAAFGQSITLDQAALFAEFQDDDAAVNQIMNDICNGRTGQHVAERLRQERADEAARQHLITQLTADGYQITDEFPGGRRLLTYLAHDGQDLTPETHAACPGRAVHLSAYNPPAVTHFCTDPDYHGHTSGFPGSALPDLSGNGTTVSDGAGTPPAPETAPAPDPARKLVIEGNKAWTAAANVRKRWLAGSLLARRTTPREAMPFITAQLLEMPSPVRDAITRASRSTIFHEITGGTIRHDENTSTWPAGRLPLAILAVIAASYEERMDGDQGRFTWRTDRRFTQCPRDDAGAYFRFLASTGYELSLIEQAVADGVPYTGDQPADDPGTDDETGTAPDDPAEARDEADRSAADEHGEALTA
jgi:ParB family transcriptional regulator, chromosome partitioning protein